MGNGSNDQAQFGLTAAFDYLVGEKFELCQCCLQASRLRAGTQFVSKVRRMFTPDEIGARLAQIDRSQNEGNVNVLEEDDLPREGPAAVAECVQQFMLVKDC
jgi:hypothetical protein